MFDIEDYKDVEPLPLTQDVTNEEELCRIMYCDEYKQVMALMRRMISKDELSVRALRLNSRAIELSPAFYTAWNYRFRIIEHLLKEETQLQGEGHDASYMLNKELDWLDEFTLNNPKNYQIWSYRQALLTQLYPHATFSREHPIMDLMLDDDSKNYHVWSYRKWCCAHFKTYGQEMAFTERFIKRDVYNNSAWSYRFSMLKHSDVDLDQELQFVLDKIEYVPQNISTWNYLGGLLQMMGTSDKLVEQLLQFSKKYIDESAFAYEFYARMSKLSGTANGKDVAQMYSHIADIDPIRDQWWNRKSLQADQGK
ncbi:CAAX geranylgeranyltransferase alpha subunit [Maudiozyma exigua]|uniref:Protein farnesyltransferase/geranylgeranyltransferase type-1 subunit alpha n=1 Tax=Maudiozyma exigua TaxID=34358 RepID=A0A9P7BCP9_MAUEX|nr:CAAX geranylgeranyltransferase alpha subunit [Kazachstania exigua]